MKLSDGTKGRVKLPALALIYGQEGTGKTTFGGSAPDPAILDLQRGSMHIDTVFRLPFDPLWITDAPEKAYTEMMDAPRVLLRESHSYKTFVSDPLGEMETIIYSHVKTKIKNLASDFGAGYELARESWRTYLADCDRLRYEKGMHIIFVAHSDVKEFRNPAGPDYDQFRVSLQDKTASLIRRHVDDVLYVTFETYVAEKAKGDLKAKGVSTGKRVAYTEFRAGWYAKNRHGMPPQIPFSWQSYADYLDQNIEELTKGIRESAERLTEQIKDEKVREKAKKFLARKLSLDELRTALSRAEELVAEQQEASGNG